MQRSAAFSTPVEDGVLKVMAKMGIADVASYRGAQLFDALGLAHEVVDLCFTGVASVLGGIGFAELEPELRSRPEAAKLEAPGYVKYRPGGEPHATTPAVVESLQAAAHALRRSVRTGATAEYARSRRSSTGVSRWSRATCSRSSQRGRPCHS